MLFVSSYGKRTIIYMYQLSIEETMQISIFKILIMLLIVCWKKYIVICGGQLLFWLRRDIYRWLNQIYLVISFEKKIWFLWMFLKIAEARWSTVWKKKSKFFNVTAMGNLLHDYLQLTWTYVVLFNSFRVLEPLNRMGLQKRNIVSLSG